MVQLVRHPQTKERDTDRLHLNHRATSRLYSPRSVWHTPAVLAAKLVRETKRFWNAFTLSVKLTAQKTRSTNPGNDRLLTRSRWAADPTDRTEDAAEATAIWAAYCLVGGKLAG